MRSILDELVDKLLEEKRELTREPVLLEQEKGGVEKKAAAPKSMDNLGLDLAEIADILVTGTESDKILKSSDAALNTLMSSANVSIDLSSAQSLVDSFSFFDFKSQEVLSERCSSLGGLMSKIALSAGLISITEQFNRSAGGYVNEAYIATLMGGQTVPSRTGGVEDIIVERGGLRVGVSLKVKAKSKLGGSFGNLLETLSIPYSMPLDKGHRTIRNSTVAKSEDRKFINPPTDPINDGGLYYLSFVGSGGDISINAYKITKADIIGSAIPQEVKGVEYYDIDSLNNVLSSNDPDVAEKATYELQSLLTPESFNNALRSEMQEVFDSLSVLDAWYGQMKQLIVSYVSTLERENFDELQSHLSSGSDFTFKAFSVDACDDKVTDGVMEQKEKKLHFSLDKLIEEVIIRKEK
jgi:hypothetical protein